MADFPFTFYRGGRCKPNGPDFEGANGRQLVTFKNFSTWSEYLQLHEELQATETPKSQAPCLMHGLSPEGFRADSSLVNTSAIYLDCDDAGRDPEAPPFAIRNWVRAQGWLALFQYRWADKKGQWKYHVVLPYSAPVPVRTSSTPERIAFLRWSSKASGFDHDHVANAPSALLYPYQPRPGEPRPFTEVIDGARLDFEAWLAAHQVQVQESLLKGGKSRRKTQAELDSEDTGWIAAFRHDGLVHEFVPGKGAYDITCPQDHEEDKKAKTLLYSRSVVCKAGKCQNQPAPYFLGALSSEAQALALSGASATLTTELGRSIQPKVSLEGAQFSIRTALEQTRPVERQLTVVRVTTGCHPAGTKILRWDGMPAAVEDVKQGDRLLGPSGVRTVQQLCGGRGEIYEVTPVKGEPFRVNADHILALEHTETGAHQNVFVSEWLGWSKTQKHLWKLWRAPAPCLPGHGRLNLDPYFVGVLLGDGSTQNRTQVTTMDPEIVEECQKQATRFGLRLEKQQKSGNRAATYSFSGEPLRRYHTGTNLLTPVVKYEGLSARCEVKSVPQKYKCASDREDRLQLLAGLMDTDGSLSRGGFDFISKSEQLAQDVAFLSRSVGLAAYVKPCRKGCQTGAVGDYFRVSISGDCSIIPTRLPRKKSATRGQRKSVLRTGFSVAKVSDSEDFFGFTLDGDSLYFLSDFTVTHNSGKTHAALEYLEGYCAPFEDPDSGEVYAGKTAVLATPTNALLSELSAKLKLPHRRQVGVLAVLAPDGAPACRKFEAAKALQNAGGNVHRLMCGPCEFREGCPAREGRVIGPEDATLTVTNHALLPSVAEALHAKGRHPLLIWDESPPLTQSHELTLTDLRWLQSVFDHEAAPVGRVRGRSALEEMFAIRVFSNQFRVSLRPLLDVVRLLARDPTPKPIAPAEAADRWHQTPHHQAVLHSALSVTGTEPGATPWASIQAAVTAGARTNVAEIPFDRLRPDQRITALRAERVLGSLLSTAAPEARMLATPTRVITLAPTAAGRLIRDWGGVVLDATAGLSDYRALRPDVRTEALSVADSGQVHRTVAFTSELSRKHLEHDPGSMGRAVQSLKRALRSRPGRVAAFTFKKHLELARTYGPEFDWHHFGNTRGYDGFYQKGYDVFATFGDPIQNLDSLVLKWTVLRGDYPDLASAAWKEFVADSARAECAQAHGRARDPQAKKGAGDRRHYHFGRLIPLGWDLENAEVDPTLSPPVGKPTVGP